MEATAKLKEMVANCIKRYKSSLDHFLHSQRHAGRQYAGSCVHVTEFLYKHGQDTLDGAASKAIEMI